MKDLDIFPYNLDVPILLLETWFVLQDFETCIYTGMCLPIISLNKTMFLFGNHLCATEIRWFLSNSFSLQ